MQQVQITSGNIEIKKMETPDFKNNNNNVLKSRADSFRNIVNDDMVSQLLPNIIIGYL